jgi:hypothetical protein
VTDSETCKLSNNTYPWIEVPVIRNAGGRAKGAVFDVAVLDTLITLNEIIIIHHTGIGLPYYSPFD